MHIPHPATLSDTEQLLQQVTPQIHATDKTVVGVDANESFSDAAQHKQVKTSTARAELLLHNNNFTSHHKPSTNPLSYVRGRTPPRPGHAGSSDPAAMSTECWTSESKRGPRHPLATTLRRHHHHRAETARVCGELQTQTTPTSPPGTTGGQTA